MVRDAIVGVKRVSIVVLAVRVREPIVGIKHE